MASKESTQERELMAVYADRTIQRIATRQRQVTSKCFSQSRGDIDKFYECFGDYHEKVVKNLPRVEAGLQWSGERYNTCHQKKTDEKKPTSECLIEFKDNAEYFVSLLD